MLARFLPRLLDDRAMIVVGVHTKIDAYPIERYERPAVEVLGDERVFARAGKARHEDDLAAKRFVRRMRRIFLPATAPEEARMIGRERKRGLEAAALAAVLAEEIDVEEDA